MSPSEKAVQLAEELLDYAHPGMTRAAAIREMATMIDESNRELIEVVDALLADVERTGSGQHAVLLNHLRTISLNYEPHSVAAETQHELFTADTQTQNSESAVAGQMP